MARWEPDSRGRLVEAALALYGERGFENTTVAEIAERAGLTERTFFRYFADKREVLFWGSSALQDLLVGAVDAASPAASPIDALASGLDAVGTMFAGRVEGSRQRHAVIAASAELRERELIKFATLAVALAAALARRGVPDPLAKLTAEAGLAVFRVAFDRWVEPGNEADLGRLMRESLDQLKAVTAGR